MSQQVSETKQHIIDTFERYTKHLVKSVDADSGKITVKMNEVILRLDYSTTTFYNWGGYNLIDYEFPFVNYLTDTGKIEIDIEEARDYYELDSEE